MDGERIEAELPRSKLVFLFGEISGTTQSRGSVSVDPQAMRLHALHAHVRGLDGDASLGDGGARRLPPCAVARIPRSLDRRAPSLRAVSPGFPDRSGGSAVAPRGSANRQRASKRARRCAR